jgi:hypothetical protein
LFEVEVPFEDEIRPVGVEHGGGANLGVAGRALMDHQIAHGDIGVADVGPERPRRS